MNSSERVERIFSQAVEIESPSHREAFLNGACGDDAALRQHVAKLLRAHEAAGGFLKGNTAAAQEAPTVAVSGLGMPLLEGPGTQIGRYKLLQQIGEGGFGLVYMAEQKEPVKRRVALKIIKLGMDTKQVVARFEAERQALAMMDHPNIAKVFDAGATESGRPYFVMELVKGVPITKFCDENNLSTKERLELFTTVCNAIQHAHQKGVIHRDVKPSNVLVTLHDGKPVPKVIDFGIAKATQEELTEKTIFTQFQQMIGTPAYMSPEQAEMSGLDIDTRTDVYSLGVLLYELLTGKTPLDAKILLSGGYDEIRRRIKEEEPPRPSTRVSTMEGDELTANAKHRNLDPKRFAAELRGDLDWIVMKALEKDRTRRYDSATGFAQDILRFLDNEPVVARPPSATYRFQKLVRRNKLVVGAATAVTVALVLGLVSATLGLLQAERERDRALAARQAEERERLRAEEQLYVANMNRAHAELEKGEVSRARERVARYLPGGTGNPDLRGFEWRLLWQRAQFAESSVLHQESATLNHAAFSPDGKFLAVGGRAKTLTVLDFTSGQIEKVFTGLNDYIDVGAIAFSPDGKLLTAKAGPAVHVWRTDTWQGATPPLPGHYSEVSPNNSIVFSPDSQRLAQRVPEGGVRFWDTRSWRPVAHIPGTPGAAPQEDQYGKIMSFSRDGTLLAMSRMFRMESMTNNLVAVEIRDAQSLAMVTNLFQAVSEGDPLIWRATSIAWAKDWLAVGYRDGMIRLWDNFTWKELAALRPYESYVNSLDFSPDCQWLAVATTKDVLDVWRTTDLLNSRVAQQTPQPFARLAGHHGGVHCVRFSPDGKGIVSASSDRTVRLWKDWSAQRPLALNSGYGSGPLAFEDEGAHLIVRQSEGTNHAVHARWDVRSRQELSRFGPRLRSGRTDHEGSAYCAARGLLAYRFEKQIRLWDTHEDRLLRTIEFGHEAEELMLSPGGEWVAATSPGWQEFEDVRVWETATGMERFRSTETISAFAFAPGDRWFALGLLRGGVQLWDGRSRTLRSLAGVSRKVYFLDFSPDARRLAAHTTSPWSLLIVDVAAGTVEHELPNVGGISVSVFTADGRTLISSGIENGVTFWNLATGQDVMAIPRFNIFPFLLLSPGDATLAVKAAVTDEAVGAIELWQPPTLAEIDAKEQARARGKP